MAIAPSDVRWRAGVNRTLIGHATMSVIDPKRTCAVQLFKLF
jgi:hypothetical protein